MAQDTSPQASVQQSDTASDSSAIGEIVVTATRRSENVQKVPISITALSSADIASRGVVQSESLQYATPGLRVQGGFAQSSPQWNIRGIGSNGFFTNDVGGVGIYIDDVYILSNVGQSFSLFDTERVEVLRGPQGTLFGANTTGGALQFVSKVPSGKTSAEASATIGNYGQRIFEGAGEFALSDKLSARFAFMSNSDDGYFYNAYRGERTGRTDIFAFRGTVKYELSSDVSAVARVWSGRSTGDELVDFQQGTYDPANPAAHIKCSPERIAAFQCVDRTGYNESAKYSNFYTLENDQTAASRVAANGASLTISANIGDIQLKSITGINKTSRRLLDDLDGSADAYSTEQYVSNSRQLTEELRIATTGSGPLQAVGGVFLLRDNGHDSYLFTLLPDYNWRYFDSKTTNAAVFGELTYKFSPEFSITGGLRYSYEKRSLSNYYANGGLLNNFVPGKFYTDQEFIANETYNLLNGVKVSDSWKAWSGRIIGNYKPQDNLMIYASVSRGFRGGNFNGGAFSLAELTPVKPEYVTTYEAGFKSDLFDRHVRFNVSAFYSNYSDLQVTAVNNGVVSFSNAGKARIYGGEAELQVRPTSRVYGSFGLSLLNAKYTEFLSTRGNFAGNQLEASPHVTFTGLGQYTLPLDDDKQLIFQGDASYTGKNYQDFGNALASIQPSYWLIGARASYGPKSGDYEVSIWGKNLTQTKYRRNWFDVSSLGFNGINKGTPRTYGATVKVAFR